MAQASRLPRLALIALAASAAAACGSTVKSTPAPAMLPPPPPVVERAPLTPPDPLDALLAESRRHAERGEEELALGHLERARVSFDRALLVLLESPGGARSSPRVAEAFDALVGRVAALEATAFSSGDGFVEKPYEPASIDELLEMVPPADTAAFAAPASPGHPVEAGAGLPIPENARVYDYIALFQGRLKGWIEEGLSRGSQYLPMIQGALRAEGLPTDLAYVALIESAFKTNALSRARAKGVWQFVRGTAKDFGLRQDWYVDERSDPEKSTAAATKYLKQLHAMFDGDWHLALASYNAGPGRVQRAMKRYKQDDFWSLAAHPRALPRETREYVPMVLAAVAVARDPESHGLTIDARRPDPWETVTTTGPVDLRHVAEWAGVGVDEIQALNPSLRRWTTPVRAATHEIRVPAGTAAAVQAQLDTTTDAERTALLWYTARSGDTLAGIARKLGVKRTDLAEANYLSTKARVRPGQRLVVPRAPAGAVTASTLHASDTSVAGSASAGDRLVYRVRRGDTLSSIARSFGTSVAALMALNDLSSSRISVGDRLTVSPGPR